MASLTPLKYGKVVGRFLANISDGPDIEDLPEFPPLSGTLTFTAGAPKVLVATAEPHPATYVQLPEHYKVSLDEFGYLTWRGDRGVKLVAPTEDTTNPSAWTWKVTFDLNYEGIPIRLEPFSFNVPEFIPGPDEDNPDEGSEGLVDLTLASPVPASNGEAVVRGLSVVDVELIGNALEFILDNGEHLDPVTIPQIEEATDAAAAAAASETAAETAASDAAAAVNSFDLDIGTVTTGAPGAPASANVFGGPPAWTLDLTLPKGDTGDEGPPAPDATDSVKGILQLTGDLGGTAASPTVPGLADKADLVHTHVATDITDSTATGRSVLTAANAGAARTAIGAGTSSLVLGTTAGTAAEGNDSRLTNTRTPTTGTVPYDICFPAFGKDTTRAASSAGDLPGGLKLQRAATFTSVTYRGITADASGNLTVELRKNGATVSGSSATIAAASQVAGGTATGSWAFAVGDILTVYITAVGTTPGKGLVADITGLA